MKSEWKERCIRRTLTTVALAAAFLGVPASAQAATESCSEKYNRKDFHRIADRTYDGKAPATRFEKHTLRKVVRCQRAPRRSRPVIAKHRDRYRNRHVYRLEVNRLTPYGRWAIPEYIVACESGGSWSAYNPSGASGPYQLLGWGAPMPANTRARRLEHHRIASRLWAGGAGASHWVCA